MKLAARHMVALDITPSPSRISTPATWMPPALAHAEQLLALTPENFRALDAKALALAGLGERQAAQAAYQAARALNSEAGIVRRAERLWGMLDL